MAIEIGWTNEAKYSFQENLNYLLKNWSEKEAAKFVQHVDVLLKRLQLFPESYPKGVKSDKYRKARINKYIVLFYQYQPRKKRIVLLTFWNTKQHPDKAKYW